MNATSQQQLNLPWWDEEPAADVPASSDFASFATDASVANAPSVVVAPTPAQMLPHRLVTDTSSSNEVTPRAVATAAGLTVFRHPQANHEIRLGEVLVAFELKRLKRRSIGMYVGPDGLSVRAPRWVGWPEIEQTLREKSRWICAKLREQRDLQQRQEAARIEWKEGATLQLFGDPVILVLDPRVCGVQLNQAAGGLPGVPRQTLHVGLPQTATAEQIRDTVNAWMQRQAMDVFQARVAHFAQALQVQVRSVKLSNARTRWGSATSNGDIRLHWRLVQFSEAIIDYVVAHELAHLREMNHSPRFWDVVASVMPQYDQMREHLRTAIIPD